MNTLKFFEVSALTRRKQKAQWEYVIHWATHPDKGSTFDRLTFLLRLLPKQLLFFLLVNCLGYDGVICYDGNLFIGHVFFQKHRRHWGIFSVFVWESHRGQDYAKRMIAECLRRAHGNTHIERVYIGNGGNPAIQHIAELAKGNQLGLPFAAKAGEKKGEAILLRDAPSRASRWMLLSRIQRI